MSLGAEELKSNFWKQKRKRLKLRKLKFRNDGVYLFSQITYINGIKC